MEERESFDKLIRVLEDATEEAARILGSDARSSFRTRHTKIKSAPEIYEYLCDLLDEAREARLMLQ
jgi:hypothetical protein